MFYAPFMVVSPSKTILGHGPPMVESILTFSQFSISSDFYEQRFYNYIFDIFKFL